VDVSSIAATGGAKKFTLTVSQLGYGDVTYTVTVNLPPAATVGNVTISGNEGLLLATQTVTITLINGAKFNAIAANTDVSGWFASPPAGVTMTIAAVTAGATTAIITFGGTPIVASTAPLGITVPGTMLNPPTTPTVANPNAKWAIAPPNFFAYTNTDGSGTPAVTRSNYTIADALNYIANNNNYHYYRLVMKAAVSNAKPMTIAKAGIAFKLESETAAAGTITADFARNTESLFTVNSGTLILGDNITLSGVFRGENDKTEFSLVTINATGVLEMESSSATIRSNYTSANGAGVHVSRGGTFTMRAGTITRCWVEDGKGYGGGVYVEEGGFFTKDRGIIYGSDVTQDRANWPAAVHHIGRRPTASYTTLYDSNPW
jgi:hypothetical protein